MASGWRRPAPASWNPQPELPITLASSGNQDFPQQHPSSDFLFLKFSNFSCLKFFFKLRGFLTEPLWHLELRFDRSPVFWNRCCKWVEIVAGSSPSGREVLGVSKMSAMDPLEGCFFVFFFSN